MTIGPRLTIWYSGVLLGSLLVLGGGLYYELVVERKAVAAQGRAAEPLEEEIGEILLFYGIPTIALTVIGGWWLTRKALSPMATLAETASRISVQNLAERLPRTGNGDEMDRLAAVINEMLGRLERSFAQEREFTLHASHELKTPLTIMRGQLETGLRDERLTEQQRELFASQMDELQRMASIVDRLSLLAKADAGIAKLKIEPVRLDELVREVVADAEMMGLEKGISVALEGVIETTIPGDRHRLRQLLLILADNGLKFNQQGGRLRFGLARKDEQVELRVANTGPGIPADKLPRVFDRFYRGDPAHGSADGGCGLGLSIARWIVTSLGGTIQITSALEQETEVMVCLPMTAELRRETS
ncbi:MAG TPA: ATP-binding protein [Verrucomicrobiota bacterium]|nr:ATP-binding protein [Verrucomicrobiota bacterium]